MNYRKIYGIAILFVMPLQLLAQDKSFTLTGKLNNVKDGSKIYLYAYDPKLKQDSAIIQNGTFEFKGNITDPLKAQLLLLHGPKPANILFPLHGDLDFFNLYLDEGMIKLNGNDSVKNLAVTASKINDEDKKLSEIIDVYKKKIQTIRAAFKQAPIEQQKDGVFINASNAKWEKVEQEIKAAKLKFAKDNPDSYVSLNALYELAKSRVFDYQLIESAYLSLSDRYKNTFLAKSAQELILTGLNTSIGSQAPDFTLPDVDGKQHKLSDFEGKYVQLEFWASWCAPCRRENPNLVKTYEKYKNKNFTILAVSVDTKRVEWLKALKEDNVPYLQLGDLKGPQVSEVAIRYRVEGIPASYLIDPTGKIIGKDLRGEELNKKLTELLLAK